MCVLAYAKLVKCVSQTQTRKHDSDGKVKKKNIQKPERVKESNGQVIDEK